MTMNTSFTFTLISHLKKNYVYHTKIKKCMDDDDDEEDEKERKNCVKIRFTVFSFFSFFHSTSPTFVLHKFSNILNK